MLRRDIKHHECPCMMCHECTYMTLNAMIIVPKTAIEMVQQSYDTELSLYRTYPRYVGDDFLNTQIHIHAHTKQSIDKNKNLLSFSQSKTTCIKWNSNFLTLHNHEKSNRIFIEPNISLEK
jgi:hypothetical protein